MACSERVAVRADSSSPCRRLRVRDGLGAPAAAVGAAAIPRAVRLVRGPCKCEDSSLLDRAPFSIRRSLGEVEATCEVLEVAWRAARGAVAYFANVLRLVRALGFTRFRGGCAGEGEECKPSSASSLRFFEIFAEEGIVAEGITVGSETGVWLGGLDGRGGEVSDVVAGPSLYRRSVSMNRAHASNSACSISSPGLSPPDNCCSIHSGMAGTPCSNTVS